MIAVEKLQTIFPHAGGRLYTFAQPLNDAMGAFEIITPLRQAAFLAQIAHESAELFYMREIASGEAYECRADLGNTEPGDGPRYKGGGPIQITGRANFRRAGLAMGVDLEGHPETITNPAIGCRASAWWWLQEGLNGLADTRSFFSITHRINGGYTGGDARLGFYLLALRALDAW